MKDQPKAVVLLSGGIDSTTTLAIAKNRGFEVYALSIRYGQRHEIELKSARQAAAHIGTAKHLLMDIDLRSFGSSALTDDIAVPKNRNIAAEPEIPVTYVPARNTIFLSLALGWAEVLGAGDIFIGANAVDYSGYPDCRPEYLEAFERLANLATKAAVEGRQKIRIQAPLLKMTKAGIIRRGVELGVDYSLTRSCYDPSPGGEACGLCDACLLRLKGFREAGLRDPIKYRQGAPS